MCLSWLLANLKLVGTWLCQIASENDKPLFIQNMQIQNQISVLAYCGSQ